MVVSSKLSGSKKLGVSVRAKDKSMRGDDPAFEEVCSKIAELKSTIEQTNLKEANAELKELLKHEDYINKNFEVEFVEVETIEKEELKPIEKKTKLRKKSAKLRIDYNTFRNVMDSVIEDETGMLLLLYANLMPRLKLDNEKEQLRSFSAKYVWGFFNKWDGLLLKEFSTEGKAKDFIDKLEGTTIRKAVDGRKVYLWHCLLPTLGGREGEKKGEGFVVLTYIEKGKEDKLRRLLKGLKENVDYKIVSFTFKERTDELLLLRIMKEEEIKDLINVIKK